MPDVTIVVCYKTGTKSILKVCLDSIRRHTREDIVLSLVCHGSPDEFDAEDLLSQFPNHELNFANPTDISTKLSSRIHGQMLDMVIPSKISTKYVMTLDSDCFPIADDWLSNLLKMLESGALCVGILHPFVPPPLALEFGSLEFRIRTQLCWHNTHVACQLNSTDLFSKYELMRYNGGDDTGLLIPALVRSNGGLVDGYRVTRCAKSILGMDSELNRSMCLVYGDRICHQGGFTRGQLSTDCKFEEHFGWAKQKTQEANGAEFLLDNEYGHEYRFDREEEVAAILMDVMFGMRKVLRLGDDTYK